MSEHTEGPWQVEGIDADGKIGIGAPPQMRGGMGPLICVCASAYADNAKNALLISAAPDLLAVCEEYIAYREGNDGCIDEIAPRMKAAISKARGQ